jgi:UTP-glucose-1-phosphate uridylyltransferase
MNKKITKAVIPAAGFGTRFLPQTKAMPKEMLPVVDKPIIQYVVEELVNVGIKEDEKNLFRVEIKWTEIHIKINNKFETLNSNHPFAHKKSTENQIKLQ